MVAKLILRCPKCTMIGKHNPIGRLNGDLLEGESKFTQYIQCRNVNCKHRFGVDYALTVVVREDEVVKFT